jgi:hypothetical protein
MDLSFSLFLSLVNTDTILTLSLPLLPALLPTLLLPSLLLSFSSRSSGVV